MRDEQEESVAGTAGGRSRPCAKATIVPPPRVIDEPVWRSIPGGVWRLETPVAGLVAALSRRAW
jgi:hypothetical protein